MTLPYVRKPSYLSPSALMELERDPWLFYLHRCAPPECAPPREPQGLGQAVGTAFDALVKRALADIVSCKCPSEEELLTGIEVPSLRKEAVGKAIELLKAYKASGAFSALVDEGLKEVHLDPPLISVPGTSHQLLGRQVGGVPLMGYPDALIVKEDGTWVILDWKTTSAGSPAQGWLKKYDAMDPMARFEPAHAKAGEDFAELHPDWAVQLATYSWLLRPGVGLGAYFAPLSVAIDQVVYGSKDIRCYAFRGQITGVFQEKLRERYQRAWTLIQTETLVSEEDAKKLRSVPEKYLGLL